MLTLLGGKRSRRWPIRAVLLFLGAAIAVACPTWAQAPLEEPIVRRPAAAGRFYPSDPDALRSAVVRYMAEATVPPSTNRLAAILVPNAAYGFSGAVAAHGFANLRPGQYDRVVVISAAHYAQFTGCSVPIANFYFTPLGSVSVDRDALQRLSRSAMFRLTQLRYGFTPRHRPIHEPEHAIEVVLPFLQVQLEEFALVPILTGVFESEERTFNHLAAGSVADTVKPVVDSRTLLIATANLTHYGEAYGFTGAGEPREVAVPVIDDALVRLISRRDTEGLSDYLLRNRVPIDGHEAIQVFLRLLPRRWEARLLASGTSAEKTGQKDRSVSYAAIAFYDLEAPPNEVRPVMAGPDAVFRGAGRGDGGDGGEAEPDAAVEAPEPVAGSEAKP